ncbi:MAG: hypothetical protein WBG89_10630 [Ornithinimicrobium sp.]
MTPRWDEGAAYDALVADRDEAFSTINIAFSSDMPQASSARNPPRQAWG